MSQSEHYLRGKEREEFGNLPGAIREFEADIEENPDRPDSYLALGVLYSEIGGWEDASKYFSRLVLLQPSCKNYYLLGEALYRIGQTVQAVEAFRMALRYEPEFIDAHLSLATLYGNSGNEYRKEVYLKNALLLEEENEIVLEELIAIYSKTFRFEEAVELCQKYLTYYPAATQVKVLLVELLMRMEKFNAAFEYLSVCMKEDPHVQSSLKALRPEEKGSIKRLLIKKKKRLLNSLATNPDPRLAVDLSMLFLLYGDIYNSAKYLVYARQLKDRIQMAG